MSSSHNLPAGLEFLALRGRAIEGYSNLEFFLCCLMADLIGCSHEVAGIIFYKITSTRSRSEILDKLFRRRHKGASRTYWNSLLREVGKLDERRNQIVHWTTIATDHPDEGIGAGRAMRPANIFSQSDVPSIERAHLLDFIIACDFWCGSVQAFTRFLNPPIRRGQSDLPADELEAWRDIFQRPAEYPPPSSHPLFQSHAALESQRTASQA